METAQQEARVVPVNITGLEMANEKFKGAGNYILVNLTATPHSRARTSASMQHANQHQHRHQRQQQHGTPFHERTGFHLGEELITHIELTSLLEVLCSAKRQTEETHDELQA